MNRTSAGVYPAFLSALAVLALAAPPASAVVTSTFTVESYQQFEEGDADSAFITSLGEVKPGWQADRLDLEFGTAWAAVRAPDGTIFLGTDDDGAVYAVRGGKASKLATIDDAVAIVSLALAADGTLYAGTMPAGQVWAIDSKSGRTSRLVTLEDAETVWSLVLDRDGRNLYAGTGPEGKLYRVDVRARRARAVFATEDKRIVSLVETRDGAIWMGTSEKALVFRYDPKRGNTRAMAHFAGNEVTALAEYDGGVIAAANELKEPPTTGAKTKQGVKEAAKKPEVGERTRLPKTGERPGADAPTPAGTEPPRKGGRKGRGALFRVRGDGQLEQLHTLSQTYFTSIAITEDGRIFAGAGDQGRIYLVDADESVSTAFDVEQRMVDHVFYHPRHGLAFTTADGAALYRVSGPAKAAVYTSKVFDARAPARFGRLVWRGAGQLAFETRTGNTGEPGPGWSEWEAPRNVARGGGGSERGRIASPPGRYVQFRVKFEAQPDAVVRHVMVYHLPQNRPTRITDVTVEGNTISRNRLETMKTGAGKPRSPVLTVKWQVQNDDGDETVYNLAVRREGEVHWRPLPTGDDPLTKTQFSWNTETFPDGHYRLRVTASDRRSNSADRALEHHFTTPLFLIDNERPRIDAVTVRFPIVTARATDSMSAIAEMAYSINDGEWQVGSTRDGLFDDLTEMLEIRLPDDLPAGMHTLAIRVADEAGNIASTTVTFRR